MSHRAMRSWKVVLVTAVFTLFAHDTQAAGCEKDSFRLADQEDADALSDCPTLTGDVVVAATAKGSIDLEGIEKISGSLTNEGCFNGATDDTQALLDGNLGAWEDCRGLESLSSNSLVQITGDFILQSLVDITKVEFRNLKAVNGTTTVEALPHLKRLNFSSLELTESVYIRHNRQLANLSMAELNNVTSEESAIELVDLGIYSWPRINIRIQHFSEESPRRLGRLLAKDLPNIPLFEFNNADEIGLLEVHGYPNQTAQLTTKYSPAGRQHGQPFTEPIASVDNFTITGFGGVFDIAIRHDNPKNTTDIKHVRIVNTSMTEIRLDCVGKPRSLHIADNPKLYEFTMPLDMGSVEWEAIEFDNNPQLSFGERWFMGPTVYAWESRFNTSILSISNSPIMADWVDSSISAARVAERLVIEPSGNVTEVCETLLGSTKDDEWVVPDAGYTCGGKDYDPKVSAAARGAISYLAVSVAIGYLASWVSPIGLL